MRLLLIRHGRSAHVQRGLLSRADMDAWRVAYDDAGISDDDPAPAALAAEVASATLLVTSDLPRAVASAQRLAPDREWKSSPLFREIPLPIPSLRVQAPVGLWNTLVYVRWGMDMLRGRHTPPDAREQIEQAAAFCWEQARAHGTVAIMTHGVLRVLLTRRLVSEGWRREPGRRGYTHWSAWLLRTG